MKSYGELIDALVESNFLNRDLTVSEKTSLKVKTAFHNDHWDKWETYGYVFGLVDAKHITLDDVCAIASTQGIDPDIVKMRRQNETK
tara:strand:- start:32 stop:292 length:261 start_codon:yes stop_codon:yes gene_type:complete